MAGGRQAWCPRCDELRAARPKAACPVCGRRLLAVPPARPGQPQPGRVARAERRLRALLPAAGAVGAALLIVAAVATAFWAGRLTRTTPSAPAAAPASASGAADQGAETGRRAFGWRAQAGGLTVVLRSITVGTGFSRLELHVDGVRRGREVSDLQGLRVRDSAGNDLLPEGELASISTAASRPAPGGGIDTEVLLDRALDQRAVAAVELDGLVVARQVEERLRGSLVDRELRQRAGDSFDDFSWLVERTACPGCRLRVACEDCRSLRVDGHTYRRGRIMIVLEALDRPERTALNPSRRRLVVTDQGGLSELPAWIDGTGTTAVVSVAASELAAVSPGETDPGRPLAFEAVVQAQAEEAVRGPWAIRQPGGAP